MEYDKDERDKYGYTPKEYELAVRYNLGDINEVQLCFLAFQNKTDENKIKELADYIAQTETIFKNIGVSILLFFLLFLIYVVQK
jgi:hypothetical protein